MLNAFLVTLLRLQFAFGACEMCLHPFRLWLCHGPVSPILRNYLFNWHVKWYHKISMLRYVRFVPCMTAQV
jgi:hypothetical protein